jgi:hypothetical protein
LVYRTFEETQERQLVIEEPLQVRQAILQVEQIPELLNLSLEQEETHLNKNKYFLFL